jgi:iron complex outermembrane receptor protein
MNFKPTPFASAAALLLSGALVPAWTPAHAQGAAAPAPAASEAAPPAPPAAASAPGPAASQPGAPGEVQVVEIKGIRAAYASSIATKKEADAVVEVVTAEDIGKLPAKNVADTLQRLPGVNVSSNSGGDGAFADANRVSIRGTAPSLTQTLINGHSVGSADWFIANQGVNGGASGRSVSYDLLPAEIVGRVIVYKSSQADLIEGGAAGSVDIQTRTPLGLAQKLTLDGSATAVYNTQSQKTDPQISGLVGWKNDANTLGVIFQAFSERRHDRRDGQEFLGYDTISLADIAAANQVPVSAYAAAKPLDGVTYANNVNATLLEMSMKRVGAMADIELKPTNALRLDLNGFYSKLTETNQDSSLETEQTALINMGIFPDQYQVSNGLLTQGTWSQSLMPDYLSTGAYVADYDKYYRPDESAKVYYVDFDADFAASDRMRLTGKIGRTQAIGATPNEYSYVTNVGNAGLTYTMHGLYTPADVAFPGYPDTANYNDPHLFLAYDGLNKVKATDTENYVQGDGEYAVEDGWLDALKFGVRLTSHERSVLDYYNDGCQANVPPDSGLTQCNGIAAWNGEIEERYGQGLGGGPGFLKDIWQLSPSSIVNYVYAPGNLPPSSLPYSWPSSFVVDEKTQAVFGMAKFAGDRWRGNAGMRIVYTKQIANFNEGADSAPPGVPIYHDPLNGDYFKKQVVKTYTDFLPSANLAYNFTTKLLGRFAVSRTLTRPDYTDLAGAVSLNGQNGTGSGGNPDLKPIRSTNWDAGIEWYFAPQSVFEFGLFYMDLTTFIGYGQTTVYAPNLQQNPPVLTPTYAYTVAQPINDKGTNKGFEVAWQQPVAYGFGFDLNYAYCLGRDEAGAPLAGSSKNTYNAEGYFENDRFSARLIYSYRSDFLTGIVSALPQYVAGAGDWSTSINLKLTDHLTLAFDGKNLTGELARQYVVRKDMPAAIYNNGKQFYLGLKYSL